MLTTAKDIIAMIGSGMRLAIPKNGSQPKLIEGLKRYGEDRLDIEVDKEVALALIPKLHHITKDTINNRIGWEEAGLDGENNDLYCCIQ